VADSRLLWLAGFAVVGSLVLLYHYLRWLKVVYIDEAPGVTSEPDSLLDQHMPIPPLSGTAGPGAQASGELTLSTISRV